ncbi:hypothetical protein D3C78_1174140 [compost metagenome]
MTRDGDVIQHPVIQTAVVLELQRTQRMGDPFQRIGNAVGEIVHRVDAPFVAGLVVFCKFDTVQHRIAHHDKRGSHVNLGTQASGPFGEFTVTHFFKQRQVLFHAAATVRAVFTRRSQAAAIFTDLLRRQFVDVSQALVDQLHRIVVQLIEVIRGVTNVAAPLKAQPLDVMFD